MDSLTLQYILVGLLFLVAVGFLVNRLRCSFKTPGDGGGCASGCGSCGMNQVRR